MDKPSQRFDEQLFTRKCAQLSHLMQAKNAALSRKSAGLRSVNMVDGGLALLREWLEGLDQAAREVWDIQCEAVTPEFVRDVLVTNAITLIETRKGVISHAVENVAIRTRSTEDRHPALQHLAMEINRLKAEVTNRYEIEARTLEHKQAHKPKPKLPEPVKSRNLGGRPRKDTERELIGKKKVAGKSWKEITNEMNQETGQQKTADAYRSLLRNHAGNTRPPGKNEQN